MLVLVRCGSFTPVVPKGYGLMSSEDMETDVRSLKLKELAGTNVVCSYGLQNLK